MAYIRHRFVFHVLFAGLEEFTPSDVGGPETLWDGIFQGIWLHNPLNCLRKTPLLAFFVVVIVGSVTWRRCIRQLTFLASACDRSLHFDERLIIPWWKMIIWELSILVDAVMKENNLTHLISNSKDLSTPIYCIWALSLFTGMQKSTFIGQHLFSMLS